MKKNLSLFAIVATTIVAVSGCSSQGEDVEVGAHFERVRSYSSVDEMIGDSDLVVSGVVTTQETTKDIDDTMVFTLSTVRVTDEFFSGSKTKSNYITVRQLGTPDEPGGVPLLETGGEYLLFLTASGLDGDLASQFYVTGAEAGLYVADASSDAEARQSTGGESFGAVQPNEIDNLPSAINSNDLVARQ